MQSTSTGNSASSERRSVPREAQRTSVKGASLVLLTRWELGYLMVLTRWEPSTRLESGKSLSVELESFSRRESELSVTLFCFVLPRLMRHSQRCLHLSHLHWIKTQGPGL